MELRVQEIQNKIYEIRGLKVMLDFDLADIYETETRILNQAVKRNIKRFPSDFMFQLTAKEWKSISSQFVMTSRIKRPKSAHPFAFTEHGATMLSSVLRSDVAIDASILVVRAFVAARNLVLNPPPSSEVEELQDEFRAFKQYIEEVFTDQNDINEDTRMQLELVNQTLAELQAGNRFKPRNPIGFRIEQEL
jgi:hypothetical protein